MIQYVVTGPGRTGSHLVENIIQSLSTPDSVLHTHLFDEIFVRPLTHKIVLVKRRSLIDCIASRIVAEATDEWYFYTDSTVPAITVSPEDCAAKATTLITWYNAFYNKLPRSANLTEFWFDEVINSVTAVQTVADRLGITMPAADTISIFENKNTRNYSEIITNYHCLVDVCNELQPALDNALARGELK